MATFPHYAQSISPVPFMHCILFFSRQSSLLILCGRYRRILNSKQYELSCLVFLRLEIPAVFCMPSMSLEVTENHNFPT